MAILMGINLRNNGIIFKLSESNSDKSIAISYINPTFYLKVYSSNNKLVENEFGVINNVLNNRNMVAVACKKIGLSIDTEFQFKQGSSATTNIVQMIILKVWQILGILTPPLKELPHSIMKFRGITRKIFNQIQDIIISSNLHVLFCEIYRKPSTALCFGSLDPTLALVPSNFCNECNSPSLCFVSTCPYCTPDGCISNPVERYIKIAIVSIMEIRAAGDISI
jgi:hypothetical protein